MDKEGKERVEKFGWPDGRKAAVCMTFDDARMSQADFAVPLFNRHGIKATFYLSPQREVQRKEEWRQAASDGHELGCHTYMHPCSKGLQASKVFLEDYDIPKMEDDLDRAVEELKSLTGTMPKSFAYPCGQTYVGREGSHQSYIPLIASRFMSGRGYPSLEVNDPLTCNMEYLQAVKFDRISFQQVKELTERALSIGGWLIFAGHETPEEYPVLEETVNYLKSYDTLWVDTVAAVADYVLGHR